MLRAKFRAGAQVYTVEAIDEAHAEQLTIEREKQNAVMLRKWEPAAPSPEQTQGKGKQTV